jgi:hypothetical protein
LRRGRIVKRLDGGAGGSIAFVRDMQRVGIRKPDAEGKSVLGTRYI